MDGPFLKALVKMNLVYNLKVPMNLISQEGIQATYYDAKKKLQVEGLMR